MQLHAAAVVVGYSKGTPRVDEDKKMVSCRIYYRGVNYTLIEICLTIPILLNAKGNYRLIAYIKSIINNHDDFNGDLLWKTVALPTINYAC